MVPEVPAKLPCRGKRYTPTMRIVHLGIAVCVASMLVGCGQKGPLVLPDTPPKHKKVQLGPHAPAKSPANASPTNTPPANTPPADAPSTAKPEPASPTPDAPASPPPGNSGSTANAAPAGTSDTSAKP